MCMNVDGLNSYLSGQIFLNITLNTRITVATVIYDMTI